MEEATEEGTEEGVEEGTEEGIEEVAGKTQILCWHTAPCPG